MTPLTLTLLAWAGLVPIVPVPEADLSVVVLEPVIDGQQATASQATPRGEPYPVFRLAADGPLGRGVQGVLGAGLPRGTLRLYGWARNLRLWEQAREGATATDEAGALAEPAYFLLSREEGGFARYGFWLQAADGSRRFHPARYVDLVVDEADLESGSVEEIFPHELGHALLRTLLEDLPPGPSQKMHLSLAVTDYPTAFDEGFAEHFQPRAREVTTNSHLRAERPWADDLRDLWLSGVDRRLRSEWVRANGFVYRPALPQEALDPHPDPYALLVQGETSTALLTDSLRNGQEMMACEGVVATLFYRFVQDERLRTRYAEASFYEPFLARRLEGRPQDAITPAENVQLKILAALRELGRHGLDPGRPWMIDFVRTYGERFPEERAAIDDIFVRTTFGATASHQVTERLQALARAGRRGDLASFAEALPSARQQLQTLATEVAANRVARDGALGPELWVLHPELKVGRSLWDEERTLPLTLNLNTAGIAELMTLPTVDLALALRIQAARDRQGFFAHLEDLRAVPGVTQALLTQLERMGEALRAAGGFHRE